MTIKDVAQLAGVSPAAVSRYMNGGPVSREKSARIREVIEKTGYSPNQTAQTMRTGRGGQIGVIIPRLNSWSASRILDGISERLSSESYMTVLGVTSGRHEQELRYLESMAGSHAAGIILMATGVTSALRDQMERSGCPVVVTGQKFPGVPCVYHDDYSAVRELMGRLIGKGRRHLAYIGVTRDDESAGEERERGAKDAILAAGISESDVVWEEADFSADSGKAAMERILTSQPQTDGVICATDMIALGAMCAARNAGRRIPEDIAIAGTGDSWPDEYSVPSLTTAHLYYRECGMQAADLLLRLIGKNDPSAPVTQTKLEYSIIERESM